MTDDDKAKRCKQIEDTIKMLPQTLSRNEIIALLCFIATGYSEGEEGRASLASQDGIEHLAMALDHMLTMRGLINETETDTMH